MFFAPQVDFLQKKKKADTKNIKDSVHKPILLLFKAQVLVLLFQEQTKYTYTIFKKFGNL
jgi:hypothetical protein